MSAFMDYFIRLFMALFVAFFVFAIVAGIVQHVRGKDLFDDRPFLGVLAPLNAGVTLMIFIWVALWLVGLAPHM